MQLYYSISLAVVISSIFTLVWVWFWTRKQELDNKLVLVVFVGGAIAMLFSLPLQKIVDTLLPGTTPVTVFLWVTIEEILKLSVVLCAIKFLKLDRAKIVVYMTMIALGFANSENVFFILPSLIGKNITMSVIVGGLRFVGGSLLHVVSSGAVGVALAFSFYKSVRNRAIIITLALTLVIVFHTIFNLATTRVDNSGAMFIFFTTWVLALILIYIIFRKDTKILKKQIGIFILIITLLISSIIYLKAELPNYMPEILKFDIGLIPLQQ